MIKRLYRKILNISLNKIKDFNQNLHFKKQAKKTLELRKKRASDYKRWEKPKELYSDWDDRTALMAGFLKNRSKIIEFGAGNMSLKKFLPPDCNYTPSDIYKRSSEVLKCDLNNPIGIDLSSYDTAVFSGVLEYVYDVDNVFRQLAGNIEFVILSYACSDISNANRLKRGWLSDYSKMELRHIFSKFQYEIKETVQWRDQSIYSLAYKREKI